MESGTNAGNNFGTNVELKADMDQINESYMRFDLGSLAGLNITQARLRMWVTSGSPGTQTIKAVADDSWGEMTINYNNKPTQGATVTTFIQTSEALWHEVDITSAVAASTGQLMSLAQVNDNTNSFRFGSDEAAPANRLELVINWSWGGGGGATPTPTPTPTATPTPTPTPFGTPTPTPPPGAGFSFGVVGDIGDPANNSATAAMLDAVAGANMSFFLATGDLSYVTGTSGSGETAWCNAVKSHVGSTYPFELVAGNHEDDGPDGLITNFAACLPHRLSGPTGTYAKEYWFNYPATNPLARIINISPGLTFPGQGTWDYSAGAHYDWVASAIDSARAAGIKWVIVSMHKYCIAMTSAGGCEVSSNLMNLLVEKKVDLYLQSHDHAYARSKQLAHNTGCTTINPGQTANLNCVQDADNSFVAGAGTVIMTNGMGGQSINGVDLNDAEKGYFATWMGSNANPTYGFTKVTVTATTLTVTFTKSSGGTYSDSFTIGPP